MGAQDDPDKHAAFEHNARQGVRPMVWPLFPFFLFQSGLTPGMQNGDGTGIWSRLGLRLRAGLGFEATPSCEPGTQGLENDGVYNKVREEQEEAKERSHRSERRQRRGTIDREHSRPRRRAPQPETQQGLHRNTQQGEDGRRINSLQPDGKPLLVCAGTSRTAGCAFALLCV